MKVLIRVRDVYLRLECDCTGLVDCLNSNMGTFGNYDLMIEGYIMKVIWLVDRLNA